MRQLGCKGNLLARKREDLAQYLQEARTESSSSRCATSWSTICSPASDLRQSHDQKTNRTNTYVFHCISMCIVCYYLALLYHSLGEFHSTQQTNLMSACQGMSVELESAQKIGTFQVPRGILGTISARETQRFTHPTVEKRPEVLRTCSQMCTPGELKMFNWMSIQSCWGLDSWISAWWDLSGGTLRGCPMGVQHFFKSALELGTIHQ